MTFIFRKAIREDVGLIIGLIGPSGGGKTYTAMRLASGMAGGRKFCVIDTEAGRAKHYADQFNFDHGELKPPFRPSSYADAIHAADSQGYKVIVVDSMSHEWAGEGGILDWQETELDRMAGDDWKKREACKMAAWIKPKMQHKQMAQRLLQVRAHLILCFRAEEKIEMLREDGKTKIVPKGWMPICEKNLPYELTVSMLLTPDAPGFPKPIKLQEQHRALFPLNQPINEDTGKRIAVWAGRGSVAEPEPKQEPKQEPSTLAEGQAAPVSPAAEAPIVQNPTDPLGFPFFHPGHDDAVDTFKTSDDWFTAFESAVSMVMQSRKLRPETKKKKANDLKTANERVLKRLGSMAILRTTAYINKFSAQLDEERKGQEATQ